MKRFLIVSLGHFLLIHTIWAQEPMMATAILKASSNSSPSNYQCAPSFDFSLSESSQIDDSFKAQIDCETICEDGDLKKYHFSKKFSPTKFGLTPGDGTSDKKIYWRTLGFTLKTWAENLCLEASSKKCGSLEEIKTINLTRISSGNWSFDGNLNCTDKKLIYSPYDKDQILLNHKKNILRESPFTPFMTEQNKNQYQNILDTSTSIEEAKNLFIYSDETKPCNHPIKIKSCFGDCIWAQEGQKEWTETLQTKEFFGDLDYKICADNYISKIKNKNWSDDVKNTLCKKFAWETILRSDAPGTSCAAFRVEVDCSQL